MMHGQKNIKLWYWNRLTCTCHVLHRSTNQPTLLVPALLGQNYYRRIVSI